MISNLGFRQHAAFLCAWRRRRRGARPTPSTPRTAVGEYAAASPCAAVGECAAASPRTAVGECAAASPCAKTVRAGDSKAEPTRVCLRRRAERGSAIVEFATLGVLFLVPTVYLIATLAQIQAATFAVEAGVREAGRVFALADDDAAARFRAEKAVELAAEDQGVEKLPRLTLDCSASPCLTPGADVVVRAETKVPLPLMPDSVVSRVGAEVTVRAEQPIRIDPHREVG